MISMPSKLPIRLASTLLALVLVAGCSTMDLPDAPKTIGEPVRAKPHYKVGAPYKIDGEWYVPKVDDRYEEEGMASWYGDDFHGKMTANGEIFDKRRLSAAHKTLPLPTLVEVENLENGKRAVVRVNDRGPFKGKRVIDLSHAAADALGFTRQGVARVRVRYVGNADVYGAAALPGEAAPAPRVAASREAAPAIAASSEPDRLASLIASATAAEAVNSSVAEIWVELAAVEDLATLEKMNLDLPDVGPVTVRSGDSGGRRTQFLRVGPFIDEAIAFASLSRVRAAGFGDARIVRGADY